MPWILGVDSVLRLTQERAAVKPCRVKLSRADYGPPGKVVFTADPKVSGYTSNQTESTVPEPQSP